MTPLSLASLASLDPTLFSFLVVVVPFAVFAMFRHRPTGPVTIHARDITIRQEARIKIE